MKIYILFLLAYVLLFSGCLSPQPSTPSPDEINSFDECVAAGNPIMESYPRQCAVPGGPSFTEVLSEEKCSVYDDFFCPAGCVVCPPCVECSSVGCHSEEFCANLGFDKDWYDSVSPQ